MGETAVREGAGGAVRRRRRSTFSLEFTAVFAAVALVLSIGAGVALTRFLASDIRAKTLDELELEVAGVIRSHLSHNLSPEMLEAPLEGEALAALDTEVREELLSPRTLRVNIFNTDGVRVYSSANGAADESSTESELLQAALQGGTVSAVEKHSSAATTGLESSDEVVEVFVPLTAGEPPQVFGVAEVYRDFTPIAAHIADMQRSVFISIAAALAALYLVLVVLVRRGSNAIRRQQTDLQSRTDELKTSYDSIVAVLCAALDLRDNVTHGHARRLSELASVVAWQMGLRKEQLRHIEKAAILHDIGKIGIPDAVLAKPGPLDDSEWAEMKRHPELGYQILRGIDFLRDAAEVVYAHHERYDGSGYPRGLKGEKIPLGARIFAVVDAYDAMSSHRPYRKALSHRKAVQEIVRNTATQFDPEVVQAFLEAEKRGFLDDDGRDGNHRLEPAAAEPVEQTASAAGD